ncbi:hypothetical protein FOZ60_006246 [Perkinsus olseni]|uniref:Retrotransposon gag domain-containing protein n=1 Tax=Perkinsus olseni TaxID=32597 RepID=A0A7J6NQ29_PEROL|nr:hypothetical protein FOZ60_006246 [Perkinsus olseni]
MANNELRNSSRDISTTLGAVPRTSLLKQLHEIETAIYEKTGASYFRLLSEFSGSVQDILSLSGVFRDDVTAAEDAPALCELWRPSFDWLTDEMIYTYPIGDEITTSWFDPLIDWTIINVAANMDHGRVLVGRKEFKEQLAISVSASRAASRHSSTPSADDIESPTLSAYNSLPSSHGPKASQSGTSSLGSAIPYDELKKKIKCIVGDPPSADHIFTGASSDNYLQWRVTILETLADADEAPNKVLAEAVISCLKGSIKAFIKRQVSRQSMADEGAMAVISVLDKRFRTSLALKALDAKFDGLHQGQGESVLQYSIKFEELLHIKQSTSPDEVLKDSTIIRCFNRGLRDSRAILMSALVDPLKTMDFITYKDSLVSICDDIP